VWGVLEDDAAGNSFDLFQEKAQLAVIGHGLTHFVELRLGERNRDGFGCHLASPLVTGAAALAGPAVLDRTLANQA